MYIDRYLLLVFDIKLINMQHSVNKCNKKSRRLEIIEKSKVFESTAF